jgi:hypothetical protein
MSTDHDGQALPPDLPVLTEVVGGDELPILTDIVETPETTDLQLPPHFEEQLEAWLMQRLLPRLEEAQHQAISQTLSELKAELPQLLRDALPPRT